jgi:hypothetical protein
MNERYFGLTDERGRYQRLGLARNDTEAEQFLQAGFIEIAKDVYDRLVEFVQSIDINGLDLFLSALTLLGALRTRQANVRRLQDLVQNREAFTRAGQAFRTEATRLAEQLANRTITLDEWYQGMAQRIRQNQLSARIAGVGTNNLSQADLQAVQAKTESELRYLQRFRTELQAQLDAGQELNPNAIGARARQYAGASAEQFEIGIQEALGMPLLPVQPGVRTECMTNCKCAWRIVELNGAGNWDCFWDRNATDSCETCIARERTFNPLRIRQGIIQPFVVQGRIYA